MRKSDKLSLPIDVTGMTFEEIIEFEYEVFKREFMNKDTRVRLNNKFIFIDFNSWIDHKAEMFWHLISLNKRERFSIFPCENNISDNICKMNCQTNTKNVTLKNGQVRNICIYRACRISWIIEIIRLANNKDKNIKIWEKDNKLHVRFKHQDVDYVVIFAINKERYQLVSAFPVFYISKKCEFDKGYQDYLKK